MSMRSNDLRATGRSHAAIAGGVELSATIWSVSYLGKTCWAKTTPAIVARVLPRAHIYHATRFCDTSHTRVDQTLVRSVEAHRAPLPALTGVHETKNIKRMNGRNTAHDDSRVSLLCTCDRAVEIFAHVC